MVLTRKCIHAYFGTKTPNNREGYPIHKTLQLVQYERKFPNFDKGLRELHIAKERHITQIINTLKCDGEYFTNLKFNMLGGRN